MKKNLKGGKQNKIFYVCGESREQASRVPALEKLKKLDYEVILLTDPLDELALQHLATYENIEIIAVDDGSTDSSYDILKKY